MNKNLVDSGVKADWSMGRGDLLNVRFSGYSSRRHTAIREESIRILLS